MLYAVLIAFVIDDEFPHTRSEREDTKPTRRSDAAKKHKIWEYHRTRGPKSLAHKFVSYTSTIV